MTERHIDYAGTYFPFPEPTRIQGEPTYTDLTKLEKELKANASSVDSDLGGGNHGYLGHVLNDPNYAAITGTTPFLPPAYPAPLVIPATASDLQALKLREQHEEAKRKHRECANVEKCLLRHLKKAVDPQYLEPFVNEDTDILLV